MKPEGREERREEKNSNHADEERERESIEFFRARKKR